MAAGIGALALLGASAGFVWREPLTTQWWTLQGARPLDPDQQAALSRCERPGWTGLVRVLLQDLPVGCEAEDVSRWLADDAGRLRLRWLAGLAADPTRSSLIRFRAGLALLYADAPPPDLSLLVTDPSLSAERRERVVELLADGRLPTGWADPLLRSDVAVRRFGRGEEQATSSAVFRLRTAALDARAWADPEARALLDAARARAGLDGDHIARWQARARQGRTVQGPPPALVGLIVNRGADCASPYAPDCFRLVADVLSDPTLWAEPGLDVGSAPGPRDGGLADPSSGVPLWEILYDGRGEDVETADRWLDEIASWVAEAPGEDRAGRLFGSVASDRGAPPVAEDGVPLVGDPLHAVRYRRASPWATALAASMVGGRAGLDVGVRVVDDLVVIEVGGEAIGIDRCGRRSVLSTEAGPSETVDAAVVMGRASLEAMLGALAVGDADEALALGTLATRLDPSAKGAVDYVRSLGEPPDAHEVAAAAAAALVDLGGTPSDAPAWAPTITRCADPR